MLGRLSASSIRSVRRLAGPIHRGKRDSLSDSDISRDEDAPPLAQPWADDERWYRRDFRPQTHNRLEPLPHGSNYFARLHQDLLAASDRVTIAGWALTPLMSVVRRDGHPDVVFAELLREVSARAEVLILLWAGAPAFFEPTTRAMKADRRKLLDIAPKVRCVLDTRAKFSHDHHQKAVSIDGRVAYVGGMDISTFQGDRWDTRDHPLRFGPGWHDVQMRIEGEAVAGVEANFCQRWNACNGEEIQPRTPVYEAEWKHAAQIVRTVPKGFYPEFAPEGVFGIRHALLGAIKRASRFIYLENQYLWAPEIFDALCEAMERNRGTDFRIVMVLPAEAYSGRYDNDKNVRMLRKADSGRRIFEAYSLYAGGPGPGTTGHRYLPIYVHAKVAIVDDEWLMIGSANLNRRGLATDTEIAIQTLAPDIATALRVDLWSEHLGLEPAAVRSATPVGLIDTEWRSRSGALECAMAGGQIPPPIHAHRYITKSTPQGRLMDRLQSMTLEH